MPFRMSATPATVRSGGPLWGEDNDYVFGELLGLSTAEIGRLETAGVIG
jgi:crotonobetainyl-CoA:carnitine CoA-transferase CaiB-like acyl-CoA transferase